MKLDILHRNAWIVSVVSAVYVSMACSIPSFAETSKRCDEKIESECNLEKTGCRKTIDSNPFEIKETGKKIKALIAKFLGIEYEDVALQKIAESTQNLRTQIQLLLLDWNTCKITVEQYNERSKAIAKEENDQLKQDLEKMISQKIEGELKNIKNRMIREGAKRDEIEKKLAAEQEIMKEEYIDFYNQLSAQMTDLETDLRNEIKNVREEVEKLKDKLDKHIAGESHESTVILEGELFAFNFDKKFRPGAIIGAEFFYPQISKVVSGLAPVVELGQVWWGNETDSYTTLPGLQAIQVKQKNDFEFVNVGLKKYFELGSDLRAYGGGLVGYSWENENDGARAWTGALMCGITLVPGNIKTALELRYSSFEISEKTVRFNPFGDSTFQNVNRRLYGISIGFLISAYVW